MYSERQNLLPSLPKDLVEVVNFVINCDILRSLMTYDYKIFDSTTFATNKVLLPIK